MRQIGKLSLTLIRHAESKFNQADAVRGFKSTQFDPELIDPELTDFGISQAQEAGKQLREKHYNVVFVSPMRRTLQTAIHIFNENVGKPKLVAIPSLTEMLVSAGEIGKDYFNTKRTFTNIDFHVMDKLKQPEFWYLDCIQDVEWRGKIVEEAKKRGITELAQIGRFILKSLEKSVLFPETRENFTRRMQEAKDTIKGYVAENGADKKYALVAHQLVLEELTRTKDSHGISFLNCQVLDYTFE